MPTVRAPGAEVYAKDVSGNIRTGPSRADGHNLPQEAPQAFAEAVIELPKADRASQLDRNLESRGALRNILGRAGLPDGPFAPAGTGHRPW